MENSDFILRTGETWKAHPALAGVYLEQLTYIVFRPIDRRNPNLPENFKDLITKLVSAPRSLKIKSYDGFSLPTGRTKIISSDNPLLIAE